MSAVIDTNITMKNRRLLITAYNTYIPLNAETGEDSKLIIIQFIDPFLCITVNITVSNYATFVRYNLKM
jgi:hypothetical protein